jgi:hypothetical protein
MKKETFMPILWGEENEERWNTLDTRTSVAGRNKSPGTTLQVSRVCKTFYIEERPWKQPQ